MTTKSQSEHQTLMRVTFWVPALENLLYIALLIILDSKRDYLLSPVFFLLVFSTANTWLLARFLKLCKLQKAAIWNPLLGPLLLWLSPTGWNEYIVWLVIAETAVLLFLIIIRACQRWHGKNCEGCALHGTNSLKCSTCKLRSCTS